LVKEVVGLANAITDVTGIEVGHYTDKSSATGCTVVLYREGAVTGVDVRGGAPGTRETDLLRPENRVDQAHAVLLSGGSAFGLNAAAGVMRYLEEQGVGYQAGPALVPIVPAAILFDLALITSEVRPGPEEGYKACLGCSNREVEEGTIGAGTGATVGKLLGIDRAIKGGIGTASLELPGGVIVGAIVAVNAHGGVVDYTNGKTIAGPRRSDGPGIYDTVDLLLNGHGAEGSPPGTNTTIGVVATNATLTKAQASFLARVSHDGLALAIRPCHTTRDGDTLFAMATGEVSSDIDLVGLGAAAVEVVARSVLRAVRTATGLGGVPSLKELGYE
jgi:L-aminopeptidase/D-esterase-like protein